MIETETTEHLFGAGLTATLAADAAAEATAAPVIADDAETAAPAADSAPTPSAWENNFRAALTAVREAVESCYGRPDQTPFWVAVLAFVHAAAQRPAPGRVALIESAIVELARIVVTRCRFCAEHEQELSAIPPPFGLLERLDSIEARLAARKPRRAETVEELVRMPGMNVGQVQKLTGLSLEAVQAAAEKAGVVLRASVFERSELKQRPAVTEQVKSVSRELSTALAELNSLADQFLVGADAVEDQPATPRKRRVSTETPLDLFQQNVGSKQAAKMLCLPVPEMESLYVQFTRDREAAELSRTITETQKKLAALSPADGSMA